MLTTLEVKGKKRMGKIQSKVIGFRTKVTSRQDQGSLTENSHERTFCDTGMFYILT